MNPHSDPQPSEVPLEVAIQVCKRHGIVIESLSGAVRKRWREEFLIALKASANITKTAEDQGLSKKTVYGEASSNPSFRHALDMAIGRVDWDETIWELALGVAREKEAAVD